MVGLAEGTSYLLLLGIAMPLKYVAGIPEAVKYTGWVHGLLFVVFGVLVLHAWANRSISFVMALGAMVAAVLPFGPFVFDRFLKEPSSDA